MSISLLRRALALAIVVATAAGTGAVATASPGDPSPTAPTAPTSPTAPTRSTAPGADPAATVATADRNRALDYVVVEPSRDRARNGTDVIYLNRCAGGCTASAGSDDASRNLSSILGRNNTPATISLEPFGWDQGVWDGVVACVRAGYAPWDVTVVTDEPTSGRYLELMVAGNAAALGLAGNTLGVAPLTNDCSPLPSAIGFAFANAHQPGERQIADLCATVIHEAGHLYGLDHELTCKDPMTYLTGCGDKIFVNRSVACGEFDGARACKCAATQNSFVHLTEVLGPGTAPPPPAVELLVPVEGAQVTSRFSVFAQVESPRVIADLTLWVNGWPWIRVPGKIADSPYELPTPADLPDGVLELELRTRDDLGAIGVVTRTVQKGLPCTDATTCRDGQACTDGRCHFPAATTAAGASCGADQDCVSQLCVAADERGVCTQPCYPGTACGDGFTCRAGDDESFACLPTLPEDAGCCAHSRHPGGSLLLLLAVTLGLARRRRRTTPTPITTRAAA